MSKQISSLWVGLSGNISGLSAGFRAAIPQIQGFSSGIAGAGSALGGLLVTAAKLTGIGLAIKGAFEAVGAIGNGFKDAANFEQAEIALTVMLKSANDAKKILGELSDFAAATPFEFPELLASTKKLVGFGVAARDTLPYLKMIGDVASGVGTPVEELAEAFGRNYAAGRLYLKDINEFQGRGIPILKALGVQTGKTREEVLKMVEQGAFGAEQLVEAFKYMTKEGAQFHGLTDKQSKSLAGLWSTLKDNVGITLRTIAESIITAFDLKQVVTNLIGFSKKSGAYIAAGFAWAAPKVREFFGVVFDLSKRLYSTVIGPINRVRDVVYNLYTQLKPVAISFAQTVWGAVTTTYQKIYDFVAPIVTALVEVVSKNWAEIVTNTVAYAQATWSVIKDAWNFVWRLTENIANGVAQVWRYMVEQVLGASTAMSFGVKDAWQSVIDIGTFLVKMTTTQMRQMSFLLNNFGDLWKYVQVRAVLAIVQIGDQLDYVLMTVIPAAFKSLDRNVEIIFTNIVNFANHALGNIVTNVLNIFANLPKHVMDVTKWEPVWVPLTNGFHAAVLEAFNIPEKQISRTEKQLTKTAEDMGKSIWNAFHKNTNDSEAEAKKVGVSIVDGLKKAFSFIPIPDLLKKADIPTPPKLEFEASIDPSTLKVDIAPSVLVKPQEFASANEQLERYMAKRRELQAEEQKALMPWLFRAPVNNTGFVDANEAMVAAAIEASNAFSKASGGGAPPGTAQKPREDEGPKIARDQLEEAREQTRHLDEIKKRMADQAGPQFQEVNF